MEENILDFKLPKCSLCGKYSDKNDVFEVYCSGCGSPLINSCSNYKCQHLLSSESAYCKYCGSKSIFLNAGLVTSKNPLDTNDSDYLPF
ncbi:hypothetical protein [Clostridium sp.]|uniref:hypothetical protein n=1 Tax=Clostridium sp. TaxID=1506 RepID=UPI0032167821